VVVCAPPEAKTLADLQGNREAILCHPDGTYIHVLENTVKAMSKSEAWEVYRDLVGLEL